MWGKAEAEYLQIFQIFANNSNICEYLLNKKLCSTGGDNVGQRAEAEYLATVHR